MKLLIFIGLFSLVSVCLSQIVTETSLVSNRYLSSNGVSGITNSENIDFDTANIDNTNWWRSSDKNWVVGQDGLYELSATVTFDQANTPDFPTSDEYDHQVHAIINGGLPVNLFLGIFTSKGNGVNTWQQEVSGSKPYNLSVGDKVAVRCQTRIYPSSILNSTLDGGVFGLTQATLRYIGKV